MQGMKNLKIEKGIKKTKVEKQLEFARVQEKFAAIRKETKPEIETIEKPIVIESIKPLIKPTEFESDFDIQTWDQFYKEIVHQAMADDEFRSWLKVVVSRIDEAIQLLLE